MKGAAVVIKIYRDRGVGKLFLPQLLAELSSWQTAFISSHAIRHTSWEADTDLLIFPGGRDVPYQAALQGEGNRKIRAFVEQGGSFLGICAGAYYGCGSVEFDKGGELEVAGDRELAFFRGVGRGPAYGPGTYVYGSEAGARAALISDERGGEVMRSYYNGGCYFDEVASHPDVEVLSRYLDLEGEPPAIIKIPVGRGVAILSGVHLETRATYLVAEEMARELLPFEGKRKNYFKHLVELLHGSCRQSRSSV